MANRTPMIAGNWKMNLTLEGALSLIRAVRSGSKDLDNVEILVAPPFTYLIPVKEEIGESRILLGAQNMHWEPKGAYTGEISGPMLRDSGCSHVILGHSERRTYFYESDRIVNQKVTASLRDGLVPIVCIGETLEEREAGKTFEVIGTQIRESLKDLREAGEMPGSVILAYEPVWAIGTGKTATPEQAQEVHNFIRERLEQNFGADTAGAIRILYGGSVKPDNIDELMAEPDIDGALVGGASLKADQFLPIIRFGRA